MTIPEIRSRVCPIASSSFGPKGLKRPEGLERPKGLIGNEKEKTTKKTEAAAESAFQETGFLSSDHAWYLSVGIGTALATATIAISPTAGLGAPFFLLAGAVFSNVVIGDFGFITADSPEGEDL